jgi:antitoxin component of RelBE/YafQ-DinJ toxin-antitoxin module
MRNITISVDDQVYQKAEAKAAELGISVLDLVEAFLIQLAEEETDFEQRKRLQRETLASIQVFSAGDRLSRAGVHERSVLP